MRRIFLLLCALVSVSVFAQVPMESAVTLSMSYAPRSSAKSATKALSSAGLIQQMGLSGGSIVCVGDASDPMGGWTFKHVLPAKVKGASAVETDLSDKIGMEVLGYSDAGTYKSAASLAPKFQTTLGRVTRNATVKMVVEPSEGMKFEFWGGMTIGYSVVQRAGATEAAWVPGAMSFSGAGTVVTSEGGEEVCWATVKATMGAFKVVPLPPVPVITAQLVGGVLANGTLSLAVTATGPSLSYQWRKDGVNIPGATSASYTATAAGTYSVVVTNSAGSVTSSSAAVTVPVTLPVITAQPSGVVLSNGLASLSVSATGSGISYQWRKDGVNIPGATSASYTATAAGTYSVVVTNSAGSVTSSGGVVEGGMVSVKGGTLPSASELSGQVVADFSIGRTEVTWGEWKEVREWAATKGYDLAEVGAIYPEDGGDNSPVVWVSWWNVVKWCNARSEKEGKTAVYEANGGVYRSGDFGYRGADAVTIKSGANGYRLPTAAEWEWAARGGVSSKGYTYSGSNVVGEVAWTNQNSGGGADLGGGKKANELGLYDMSGNVWEWVWDGASPGRTIRGGSWADGANYAEVSSSGRGFYPDIRNRDIGFRVASFTVNHAAFSSGPIITAQPSGAILWNGLASLSVSATGSGISYQWRKDGVNIPGATSASYTATAAGTYSVVVTNSAGSATSIGAVVTVPGVGEMVLVKGGTLPSASRLSGQVVADFSIGRTEVTWGEWKEVREWAATKGYDLAGVGKTYPENGGDNLPVVGVSWYEVVKWCNARSEKEGKTALYEANGGVYRSGDGYDGYDAIAVTIKSGANGYRLPTAAEWEWAARGGVSSRGCIYSGSNMVGEVAWTSQNSGRSAKAVGGKKANELGLYDMSGNVTEWLWDLFDGQRRLVRGGSWDEGGNRAEVSNPGGFDYPDSRIDYNGFRVAFSSGQ